MRSQVYLDESTQIEVVRVILEVLQDDLVGDAASVTALDLRVIWKVHYLLWQIRPEIQRITHNSQ